MHALGVAFVDGIVGLFFIGLAGSAVVILISFVEDFHELFNSDESPAEAARPPQSTSTVAASAGLNAPKSTAR